MKGSKIMLSVFVELSKVFDNTDVNRGVGVVGGVCLKDKIC